MLSWEKIGRKWTKVNRFCIRVFEYAYKKNLAIGLKPFI